jgi:hypothetical protein
MLHKFLKFSGGRFKFLVIGRGRKQGPQEIHKLLLPGRPASLARYLQPLGPIPAAG